MCGIAGILSSNPSLVTAHRLIKMTDALAHRGPDGAANWTNSNGMAGLAHRRLAIIDLSDAAIQPMHYLNRYTIVHNGEIYNYKELRATLSKQGYHFRSQSDTEVIMAAYDLYKSQCLQYFDGMFAFAIWDEQEQELFAARDRFGEKPFYYSLNNTEFVFSSEMKALWAAGIEKRMEETMLYNYITLGYVQDPGDPSASFYHSIRKLPARHFLYYRPDSRELSIELYWDIEPGIGKPGTAPEQAIEKFRDLFQLSVNRRLRSDVAVGSSLSGGLDSSSVLAAMLDSPEKPGSLSTFSAVFNGFEKNEAPYIHQLTAQLNVPNYQVHPDADSLLSQFEKICYHQEEPFGSSNIIAQFQVFEMAKRQGVTVLLDGQGADEVLAGYLKYYPRYWQELYRSHPSQLAAEIEAARQLGITESWGWKNKLAARFPSFAAAWLVRNRTKRQRRQPDLDSAFVESFGRSHYATAHIDSLDGLLYYNTFMNGLEELLQYADRNSMAHGREVRLPFLHHELAEFVFSLPAQYKIRSGWTKWLLRKSMENSLPETIVWRKDKVGFETPQRQWMEQPAMQEYVHEAKRVLVNKGILKRNVLTKKIQPLEIHAADNYDWRYLVAGTLLR